MWKADVLIRSLPGGREKQAGLGTGWQHTERPEPAYGGAGRERGCLLHPEKLEFKMFQLRGNPNLKGLLTGRDQSVGKACPQGAWGMQG